jgi:hypothetical protein
MTNQTESSSYTGGCHCGAVRFQVIIDRDRVVDCNCSICRKKRFLHLIVPPEKFQLLQGEELLTTYTFNTHTAKHTFCSICGIHAFYYPRSHPGWIDVNIHTLDRDLSDRLEIIHFDGKNWEQNVNSIQNN